MTDDNLTKSLDVIDCNKRGFDKLCKKFEALPQSELHELLSEYFKVLLNPLAEIYNDKEKPKFTLMTSALVAANIDGEFTVSEFRQTSNLLELCFGRKYSFEEAKEIVQDQTKDLTSSKAFVENVYDMLHSYDETMGAIYIMFLTGIICADKDASRPERKWIYEILKK